MSVSAFFTLKGNQKPGYARWVFRRVAGRVRGPRPAENYYQDYSHDARATRRVQIPEMCADDGRTYTTFNLMFRPVISTICIVLLNKDKTFESMAELPNKIVGAWR